MRLENLLPGFYPYFAFKPTKEGLDLRPYNPFFCNPKSDSAPISERTEKLLRYKDVCYRDVGEYIDNWIKRMADNLGHAQDEADVLRIIFPELETVIGDRKREISFLGEPAEVCGRIIMNNAREIYYGYLAMTPEEFWERLDLHPAVRKLTSIYDWLLKAREQEQNGNPVTGYQLNVLFNLMRPALLKIILERRRPHIEETLYEFLKHFYDSFQPVKEIVLYILTDPDGKCSYLSQREYDNRKGFNPNIKPVTYTFNRVPFGNGPNDYAMIEARLKSPFSTATKLVRGRCPNDIAGIRIIVEDDSKLPTFIERLKKNYPQWLIIPDKDRSINPYSAIPPSCQIKYYAYKGKDRIEIQLDTLVGQGFSRLHEGTWIKKMVEAGRVNEIDYKTGQIFAVAKILWPEELYGIDWTQEKIGVRIRNSIIEQLEQS